jgi:hypothetical protein
VACQIFCHAREQVQLAVGAQQVQTQDDNSQEDVKLKLTSKRENEKISTLPFVISNELARISYSRM